MNYTSIIVDDEPRAIRTLTAQLSWTKLPIEVIGNAISVEEARAILHQKKPDFIFLDIKMPESYGFDLFSSIDETVTDVIFTTAHEEYSLKAFKLQASGYLMKPVSTAELRSLLEKLIHRRGKLAKNQQDLILDSRSGILRLPTSKIVYISAQSGMNVIYLEEGKTRTTTKLLKELEVMLTSKGFVRCHNKYLVNTAHIVEITKAKNASIKLTNGLIIPVSRAKKLTVYSALDT